MAIHPTSKATTNAPSVPEMTPHDAARLGARRISENLLEAIAAYEVYLPSGQDRPLIARVNANDIKSGFCIISESLHHIIVLSLCRIWDTRTTDSASIGFLKRKIKTLPQTDKARFAAWSDSVTTANKSAELAALRKTRNNRLAHTSAHRPSYRGTADDERYGVECKVIKMTIPLIEEANAMIGYTLLPFAQLQSQWTIEGEKFWAAVLPDG